jgi:sugar phosphate isomerase/epimerase
LNKFFIHIPLELFDKYIDKAIKEAINIDVFLGDGLLDKISMEELSSIREMFFSKGLAFSIHAPFVDISPGSTDPKIVDVARQRIVNSLFIAFFLKVKVMVCHAGSEVLKYGIKYEKWLENSIRFWNEIKYYANEFDVKIAIENTNEKTPDIQCALVEAINSPNIGYCFDIGHWNILSELPIENWLNRFKEKLFASHIHDNYGKEDDHLALGAGNIDFKYLIEFVKKNGLSTTFIVENKDEENVMRSLQLIRGESFFS